MHYMYKDKRGRFFTDCTDSFASSIENGDYTMTELGM